jgi:uncharacterized membrane protein
MAILTSFALWLHDLATVILIGHYLLLVLVYLPLMASEFQAAEMSRLLGKVNQCVQPWMGLSLLIFMATGILLMFADPNYLGVGNFGNSWSILMVLKHMVVIGMIAVAFWITTLTRPAMMVKLATYNPHPPILYRMSAMIKTQAALGVLVLFLTGLARMG